MGYDVARFVSEIDEEFQCSICKMVLENPMQSSCEQIFCNECIKEWLTDEVNCPVDCCSTAINNWKPMPRYFRNILDKMEIRCDFGPKGCEAIVPLEQLKDHLARCLINPEAEVTCDKGCNIKMTRREYEMNNCFTHLVKWQQIQFDRISSCQEVELTNLKTQVKLQREDITKLNDEAKRQQEEITKFNDVVGLQREEIFKLSDMVSGQREELTKVNDKFENELMRYATVMQSQQEDITKLNEELSGVRCQVTKFKIKICCQQEEMTKVNANTRILWNATPKWPVCQYMKTSIGQPQILEYDGSGKVALAQIFFSLDPNNAVFKIKGLSVMTNNFIGIGLTRKGHPTNIQPGLNDTSISYSSKGDSFISNKNQKQGKEWKNGDIIECGIRFPDNFVNDGNSSAKVYFSVNEQFVFSQVMEIPLDGLFPTIFMWSQGNSRLYGEKSKVEFLNLVR